MERKSEEERASIRAASQEVSLQFRSLIDSADVDTIKHTQHQMYANVICFLFLFRWSCFVSLKKYSPENHHSAFDLSSLSLIYATRSKYMREMETQ